MNKPILPTLRPQNQSCPAGGTTKSKGHPQRGVVVAPPSGNTSHPDAFRIVHRGFDMLALAIKAQVPPALFDHLEAEKERAETERRDVQVDIDGERFLLSPHGGGGYRFLLNGGPDGARWSFKKPNAKDPWGVRVTVGSRFLALHGLGAARSHIDYVMEVLGFRYGPDDISLSRIDYCVDFLLPGFALDPEQFVMHSAALRRDHIEGDAMSITGKSGRTTSCTIGKMPGRQVILYDKRAEVIAKHSPHWWEIWNTTLRVEAEDQNPYATLRRVEGDPSPLQTLSPDSELAAQNRVWRVEFRAGKKALKDTWGIRTWSDMFERYGDLIQKTGEAIRYTEPTPGDSNRARWPNHMLWEIICAEMQRDLFEMHSGADPMTVKEVNRMEHIGMIYRGVLGNAVTFCALHEGRFEGLEGHLNALHDRMLQDVRANPERMAKQFQEAKERYVFMGEETS
jgi:hypothetical protein